MLQLPQVLARLPKSVSDVDSEPLAADVFGLAKGKKRKRSELAIAVNGEAINLYDVRYSNAIEEMQDSLLKTCRSELPL